MSCQRDLRNGVSELSFGHRPQLAIAADDQHQPLRGCKSISQPSHFGQQRPPLYSPSSPFPNTTRDHMPRFVYKCSAP